MTLRRLFNPFAALVLLATCFVLPPAGAAAAAPVRLRIGVTADGIVQVTAADLAAAGVDPAAVDPRTFAMSSLGVPVAIRVTGEAGGVFGSNDRILFFGQKFRGTQMEEKYTDERVYWLDIGGTAGPRIPDVDARPQLNLTPPADVTATLRAEQNVTAWALHCLCLDTQDTWFWESLQPGGVDGVITATLPYTVPDPAPGAQAKFRLEEIGRAYGGPRPNHRTTIAVNGSPIIDQTWSDKQRTVFTAILPAGALVNGTNNISVGAWTMPGNYADWVYANYWEVDYRRLFRASQDRFDFRSESAGPHEYVVDGWSSKQIAVWDISDPEQPRALTGALAEPVSVGRGVRFRTDDVVGSRFWLQDAGTYRAPASVRLRPATGLRDRTTGADAVIVAPAVFLEPAQRLAAWHEAHGRRALVAELQDVYDEFNEGIANPAAVQKMLIWGSEHWPAPAPAYLTLVGAGHYNLKGYNTAFYGTRPVRIPPFLAWADPWQGEVAADALYGDLDSNGVPEVAVGRLAVNTLDEANVVVEKIVTYDEEERWQSWQRQALFAADNTDDAGNFRAVSDAIIADYLPADMTVTRAYLPGTLPSAPPTAEEIVATRKVLSDTLQAGVLMVQYTGHGAPELWAYEPLLTNTDIAGLQNGARLPVVMSFNCLDGYFIHPQLSRRSVAEAFQRQPGGGAVATISPAGLGVTTDQRRFRELLMTVMFKEGVREIGKALTLAKQRYYATYGANYLIKTMMLFGDPALRLPQAATRPPQAIYLPAILR